MLTPSMQEHTQKYRQVQEMVAQSVSALIPQSSLARDITNSVLLSFVREDAEVDNLQSWVSTRIDKFTERHISELWKYCFSYALLLLKNEDSAQDVTQTVMISLLQTRQPVEYVKAWLKRAVSNQAMLFFNKQKGDRTFFTELRKELGTAKASIPQSDAELDSTLDPKSVKKLLSKEDYLTYCDIKSKASVKAWALARGMSYSKARDLKHQLYKNLKASYLKQQGWLDSPDILDFRQLMNIKRFLDTLLVHAISKDFSRIFHYANKALLPDIQACFQDFREITDWGLHMNPDGSFNVTIMDITNLELPITIKITITLNQANYIKIVRCITLPLMVIIPEALLGRAPSVKGRCTLTLEQIKAYM